MSIGSTRASFIFDGLASLFEPSSGCTILVRVPLVPYDPYFKAELFPSLQVKLDENQSRFNRNLGQGKRLNSLEPKKFKFIQFNFIFYAQKKTLKFSINKKSNEKK